MTFSDLQGHVNYPVYKSKVQYNLFTNCFVFCCCSIDVISRVWVLWVVDNTNYPHMPIGKVWIYRLLFVCLFVCVVTDFSTEDKASGVKFCTAVHRHPRQGISHFCEKFCELCFTEAQNWTNLPARPCCNVMLLGFCDSHAYQVCGVWT